MQGGIYTGMLLAGTQEPHFINKGLGYSQGKIAVRPDSGCSANPPNPNFLRPNAALSLR